MEPKINKPTRFFRGDKVLFVPESRLYDFGYISQTGHAVIYEEGECNMQDSYAVDLENLIKINKK